MDALPPPAVVRLSDADTVPAGATAADRRPKTNETGDVPGSAEPINQLARRDDLERLRAPEMASELFVSTNTIKTHLRHIYAKLGVHNRAAAVARARELGLLAPSHRRH